MLLRDLQDTTSSSPTPIVDNVTGMKDMVVIVEVCKAYLEAQAEAKGQSRENVEALKTVLKIKSDLAVSMLFEVANSEDEGLSLGELKRHRLLYCNYHIKMKTSHDALKHGGRQAKSQLIAESLARSIELNTLQKPRKVLFSLLTDCCVLYVLVHFPGSGNAYLSRREVEPGRMVAIIAWVHFMSLHGISNDSSFSEKSFIEKFSVGQDSFADDFLKQKRVNNLNSKQKSRKKRPQSTKTSPEQLLELVVDDEEDEVVAQRLRMKQEAFATYRNHYNFGWPLPPMETNLVGHINDESLQQERLARAGLR
jgi:hypothetical protein